ncbi:nucleotide kinase [Escherichia phage pO103]|uniref:Nucleotide kinase n=1 Tax=Escherichia phage pO103 TaxID=3072192 RepID=A0AA51R7W2_9CAUD|nr:nucleotide kinase [Escherichia phage pO103]
MTSYDAMIIKLINMNEGSPDHLSNCSFHCAGVPCSICPAGYDEDMTLGEIRAMDPRAPIMPEKPAEVAPTEDQPQDIEGVRTPSHYMLFDDIEAIEVIARSMTREQFKGYCLGNILKYRLRAGKKSELAFLEKDMAKAGFYGELFEKHKDKCYDY